MIYGVVYQIQNLINGKIYVGVTTQDPILYWNAQYVNGKGGQRRKLRNAILKYGIENFSFFVFDDSTTKECLEAKEEYWIRELNAHYTLGGYNIKWGGNVKKHCEETKDLIRRSLKGKKKTKEHCEKMSIASIGNKSRIGKKHSLESKEKMSIKRKGKSLSIEHCKSLSIAKVGNKNRLGKKDSKETIDKKSNSTSGEKNPMFGRKHSPETKEKIRLARKAFIARNKEKINDV